MAGEAANGRASETAGASEMSGASEMTKN